MAEVELHMEVPGQRVMYAIITKDGNLKGSGKSAGTLYKTAGAAQNHARTDGDSVIKVTLNLREEPIFIRRRAL
jgi:hypothetical protein